MLLTVPQKYAKSLLKDFGALRKSHVEKILRIKALTKFFLNMK